jgi:hypothetical protein
MGNLRFLVIREPTQRLGLDFFEVMFEAVPQDIMSEIAAHSAAEGQIPWKGLKPPVSCTRWREGLQSAARSIAVEPYCGSSIGALVITAR